VRQRFISRQLTVFSAKRRGGSSARCGQCLKAKAGEKTGGPDIPWIRNYKGAGAIVKRAEAGCLFVLSDSHTSFLTNQISPSYCCPGHTNASILEVLTVSG